MSLSAPSWWVSVPTIPPETGPDGPWKVCPTFVTWTFNDEAPYFCVEPWMGPPNAAETKVGLLSVAPGQTQKFYTEVSSG